MAPRPRYTARTLNSPTSSRLLLLFLFLIQGVVFATPLDAPPKSEDPASYLYLWVADSSGKAPDFLAVVDADPRSQSYTSLLTTLPVGASGTIPHHTEAELHSSGILLANGFGAGKTFIFDLNQPTRPKLLGQFDDLGGFSHAHSFVRLDDGNVLSTFQFATSDHGKPGGLVELTPDGKFRRASRSAENPVDGNVRPYSPAVLKSLDRVVSTTTDMHGEVKSRAVQIWRFSDLQLLHTLLLPEAPGGRGADWTAEPRVLADGKSVLVSTFTCGLYVLTALDTPQPRSRFLFKFDGDDCGVPLHLGRYWVQTLESAQELVVLDIAELDRPRVVSRLKFEAGEVPHWIAYDPLGKRIVVTGDKELSYRVVLVRFDPETGALAWDDSFRERGSSRRGINLERTTWPHGKGSPGKPHGAVFSLK